MADALFDRAAVLELENLGDDDDKAFVMGLVFVRLVERLKAAGESQLLRHVSVIEEAHRLFSTSPRLAGARMPIHAPSWWRRSRT